jgi:hypothetical protein
MRVVSYTGGVNGKMIVEVKNPGAETAEFDARGLYFVPEVAPERAPQREAAAGPLEVASLPGAPRTSRVQLEGSATARLRLQVFCLDAHRASPSSRHRFRVARARLPQALVARIDVGAAAAISRTGGDAEAARGEIQTLVWGVRNQRWIALEGERRGEGPGATPVAPAAPASRPVDSLREL